MTRDASCEERLPEHLEGRLEDMRNLTGWYSGWSRSNNSIRAEDAERRMQEYPLDLSFRKTITMRLELSTGGPADFITAEVEDGDLRNVVYHFQDWYDGASRILTGDERATVQSYVEHVVDLDSAEAYAHD